MVCSKWSAGTRASSRGTPSCRFRVRCTRYRPRPHMMGTPFMPYPHASHAVSASGYIRYRPRPQHDGRSLHAISERPSCRIRVRLHTLPGVPPTGWTRRPRRVCVRLPRLSWVPHGRWADPSRVTLVFLTREGRGRDAGGRLAFADIAARIDPRTRPGYRQRIPDGRRLDRRPRHLRLSLTPARGARATGYEPRVRACGTSRENKRRRGACRRPRAHRPPRPTWRSG